MRWFFERLFGARLEAQTSAYLRGLTNARSRALREQTDRLMKALAGADGPSLSMGHLDGGEAIAMPIPEFMRSHAFMSGASGSGKTTFVYDKERSLLGLWGFLPSFIGLPLAGVRPPRRHPHSTNMPKSLPSPPCSRFFRENSFTTFLKKVPMAAVRLRLSATSPLAVFSSTGAPPTISTLEGSSSKTTRPLSENHSMYGYST